mmetsp:Transcript_45368/g.117443  ORF Transcript_45368/g.117443 Transcript_45368/m.117443 type:complete len:96 (-) Transcript_45368:1188-1475(-)
MMRLSASHRATARCPLRLLPMCLRGRRGTVTLPIITRSEIGKTTTGTAPIVMVQPEAGGEVGEEEEGADEEVLVVEGGEEEVHTTAEQERGNAEG